MHTPYGYTLLLDVLPPRGEVLVSASLDPCVTPHPNTPHPCVTPLLVWYTCVHAPTSQTSQEEHDRLFKAFRAEYTAQVRWHLRGWPPAGWGWAHTVYRQIGHI